jgi:hypothetical protein
LALGRKKKDQQAPRTHKSKKKKKSRKTEREKKERLLYSGRKKIIRRKEVGLEKTLLHKTCLLDLYCCHLFLQTITGYKGYNI